MSSQKGVALVFVDHIGARPDRLLLEAFGADLLVIGLGQDIAGQERHPHEEGRLVTHDVGGDPISLDFVIAGGRPDERYGIGAVLRPRAFERPHDVLGRERRPVVPFDVRANVHPKLGLVVVPAPRGQEARLEREVRHLPDILVEDGAIDGLDAWIDSGGTVRRIERRQVDVIGDGERVLGPRPNGAPSEKFGEKRARAERQGLAPSDLHHP